MSEDGNNCHNCKYDYHNMDVDLDNALPCYNPDQYMEDFWVRPVEDCWEAIEY